MDITKQIEEALDYYDQHGYFPYVKDLKYNIVNWLLYQKTIISKQAEEIERLKQLVEELQLHITIYTSQSDPDVLTNAQKQLSELIRRRRENPHVNP